MCAFPGVTSLEREDCSDVSSNNDEQNGEKNKSWNAPFFAVWKAFLQKSVFLIKIK